MDAEIEVLDGVVEGELVEVSPQGVLERARHVVANPRSRVRPPRRPG
jgi:hypothetical protein